MSFVLSLPAGVIGSDTSDFYVVFSHMDLVFLVKPFSEAVV